MNGMRKTALSEDQLKEIQQGKPSYEDLIIAGHLDGEVARALPLL